MGAILTRLSVMCGQRLLRGGECTPSHTKREALNTGCPLQTTKSQKIIKDHIRAIKKKKKNVGMTIAQKRKQGKWDQSLSYISSQQSLHTY